MEDFRVVDEATFSFKKNKLYVMLLREYGEFAVEVANKTEGFGRKFAEDKVMAVSLFDAIIDRLSSINTIEKAETTIKNCFSLKNINEIIFLLKSEDVVRTQVSIGDLYDSFKFKVKAKTNYRGDKKSKGGITIYIYFNKNKKPIGRFIGTDYIGNKNGGKDFIFERL